jgi:hypothetical protein
MSSCLTYKYWAEYLEKHIHEVLLIELRKWRSLFYLYLAILEIQMEKSFLLFIIYLSSNFQFDNWPARSLRGVESTEEPD